MIAKKCLTSQWIKNKQKEIKADPILIEKAIFGFELLLNLVKSGIHFVFKGGTSLMLLFPEVKRLSIDLDIITEENDDTLVTVFNNITKGGVFKRWEEDKRILAHEIPKHHFKLFYDSPMDERELYILLDVVQMNSPFPKAVEKTILHDFIEVEEEIKVTIPTVNGLTADKLTAFAPTTIGIPYGKDKSMEIIKQLYDLGILFQYITDLKEIRDTYKKIAKAEASFRKLNLPVEDFLNDSIDVSFLLCQLDFRGGIENNYTRELRDGVKRIKSHIISGKYSMSDAKNDASKIACLASLIKDRRLDINIEKLRQKRLDINTIKNILLPEGFAILNKLKITSPESFYFWAVATQAI
jgi:hypothetical protein